MLYEAEANQGDTIDRVNFNQQYNQLVAGVNRIRYLKKKQQKNHMIMNQHFSNILNRLNIQKQRAQEKSKSKIQLPRTQSQQPSRFQRFKYIFSEESPYKPKMSKSKSGLLNFLEKEEGSKLFENKLTDVSLINRSHLLGEIKTESRREKFRLILKQKQQNGQFMREMKAKMEEKAQSQKIEQIELAKRCRQRVELSRQEGRKKIQEHYYQHLQAIRQDKEAKRRDKIKLEALRYKQMLELQKQEQQQLQLFEKSILVEQELKSFIEQAQGMAGEAKITEDTTLI